MSLEGAGITHRATLGIEVVVTHDLEEGDTGLFYRGVVIGEKLQSVVHEVTASHAEREVLASGERSYVRRRVVKLSGIRLVRDLGVAEAEEVVQLAIIFNGIELERGSRTPASSNTRGS